MDKEDLKKFRKGIPPWIDTGSSIGCLLETLLGGHEWNDEEFLDWVHERKFTEKQLKEVIYQLDREGIIAIDPYDDFAEVQEYKPNTCKHIRMLQKKYKIEQKYGHIEEEEIKEDVMVSYLLVCEKNTKEEKEFPDMEAFEEYYSIGWEDRREYRKGQPSRYDDFNITEKYREAKKFIGRTKKVIIKPDGEKLYGGNKYKRIINLLLKYEDI